MDSQGPIFPSPQEIILMENKVHHLLKGFAQIKDRCWMQIKYKKVGKWANVLKSENYKQVGHLLDKLWLKMSEKVGKSRSI